MFRVAKHLIRAVTGISDDSVDISEVDGVRALHLGSVTIQSAMRIKDPLALELAYTRGIMCFLLFTKESSLNVLAIGLGGGSLAKYMHAYCPNVLAKVLELNPKIIQIARSQFYVPENDEALEIIEGDGLQYLAEHTSVADVLMIDAFDSNGIPPDFRSQDFFDQCANTLNSEGILAINLWGSDKKFDSYLQRIEHSFAGNVLILPTGKPGNIVVFGFKRAPIDLRIASLRERAKILELSHKIEFLQFVEKLTECSSSNNHRIFMKNEEFNNGPK